MSWSTEDTSFKLNIDEVMMTEIFDDENVDDNDYCEEHIDDNSKHCCVEERYEYFEFVSADWRYEKAWHDDSDAEKANDCSDWRCWWGLRLLIASSK